MTTAAAEDREHVGPYRVIQAIGAGGSARIDLARIDRAYGFQRHVVIKRPLEHLRGSSSVAASLRREARIGGQLRHPNLVAILDAGVHDGYDYLVLEYVHGAALRTLMQAEAPGRVRELPLAVTLAIVTDVARGMHEAHELTDDRGAPLGLVHRDVSPGNILLGLDGTVKLADFGIAKETRISTLSGSMHGTVTYMAPEQCQGHAFDRRADVFSLGVILFELVTGARLFWADNDVASLHRVLSGTVPRPRKLRPQIPSALEDILLIAVAHDPEKRYPTALALAHALEAYAARTGEVLGARWIARTMEDAVGARQVPWIATAVEPQIAPGGDGSLVELIAAAEPDEPASPSFGDTDDDLPAVEPASEPSSAPPDASPGPQAGRPPRRKHTLAAAIVALGMIGGGVATALVLTRSRSAPASLAPATGAPASRAPAPASTAPSSEGSMTAAASAPGPASTAPSASAPGPASMAPSAPSPGPASTAPSAPSPKAAATAPSAPSPGAASTAPSAPAPGAASTAPSAPATASVAPHTQPPGAGKKRRPVRSTRAASRATAAAGARDDARTEVPAAAAAPGAGSGSAVRPPANVEWKPTLLLPTDGSGARTPK
jgi:serine/threonine-protein kinase